MITIQLLQLDSLSNNMKELSAGAETPTDEIMKKIISYLNELLAMETLGRWKIWSQMPNMTRTIEEIINYYSRKLVLTCSKLFLIGHD